ncbi:cyclin D2, partial [Trifolium medium]|nr:cyclin D2 [Trifolium medium]
MAPSFDCVNSLLCTEEDSSVFDDAEYGGGVNSMEEVYEDSWHPRFDNQRNQQQRFVVPDELPLQSEECLVLMLEKEFQQWPGADYLNRLQFGVLDVAAREEAINWIQKVQAHFGFGPLCGYLSINYMDRFLVAYELP